MSTHVAVSGRHQSMGLPRSGPVWNRSGTRESGTNTVRPSLGPPEVARAMGVRVTPDTTQLQTVEHILVALRVGQRSSRLPLSAPSIVVAIDPHRERGPRMDQRARVGCLSGDHTSGHVGLDYWTGVRFGTAQPESGAGGPPLRLRGRHANYVGDRDEVTIAPNHRVNSLETRGAAYPIDNTCTDTTHKHFPRALPLRSDKTRHHRWPMSIM